MESTEERRVELVAGQGVAHSHEHAPDVVAELRRAELALAQRQEDLRAVQEVERARQQELFDLRKERARMLRECWDANQGRNMVIMKLQRAWQLR